MDFGWCVKCTLGEDCPKHRDCRHSGCKSRVWSGFWCPTHYRQNRLNRDIREYGRESCSKCDGTHYALGLCRRHYRMLGA